MDKQTLVKGTNHPTSTYVVLWCEHLMKIQLLMECNKVHFMKQL